MVCNTGNRTRQTAMRAGGIFVSMMLVLSLATSGLAFSDRVLSATGDVNLGLALAIGLGRAIGGAFCGIGGTGCGGPEPPPSIGLGAQVSYPLGQGRWRLLPFFTVYPYPLLWGGCDILFNAVDGERFNFYLGGGLALAGGVDAAGSVPLTALPDARLGAEWALDKTLVLGVEAYVLGIRGAVGVRF